MTVLGLDLSHHQEDRARIDFPAVRRAGYRFVILKATEGSSYVDPTFAAMRARARAAGLTVGAYHFARAGSITAEVNRFVRTVGALNPGELVVLDWEVPAADPVTWCRAWLRAARDTLGVRPLIYMNQSARDGHDWAPVIRDDFGLWLARYDNVQTQPSSGQWPTVAMKQFTDAGAVPGVSGGVDVNVFYGDMTALARYGYAAPAPTPSPAPTEDNDMRLNAYRVTGTAEVRAGGPGIWWHVPNTATLQGLQRTGSLGPTLDVSQAEFDAARAVWLSAVVNTPLEDDRGDWPLSMRLPAIDAATQGMIQTPPAPEV